MYVRFAQEHAVTLTEYDAVMLGKIRDWVREAEVRVRIPRDVLPRLLRDGRLKNQFETGASQGALNPPLRAFVEERLFAIPTHARPSVRPVYGYLEGSSEVAVRQYGVVLRLSSRVRRRTTFTLGDTLNDTARAATATLAPVPLCRPTADAALADIDLIATESLATATPRGYAEAQIHLGVRLADIAEVVFTAGAHPSRAAQVAMARARLAWRTVTGDEP